VVARHDSVEETDRSLEGRARLIHSPASPKHRAQIDEGRGERRGIRALGALLYLECPSIARFGGFEVPAALVQCRQVVKRYGVLAVLLADSDEDPATEMAMPTSTDGIGSPSIPAMPPNVMIKGNTIGKVHTDRPPICAPHSPTANMARK